MTKTAINRTVLFVALAGCLCGVAWWGHLRHRSEELRQQLAQSMTTRHEPPAPAGREAPSIPWQDPSGGSVAGAATDPEWSRAVAEIVAVLQRARSQIPTPRVPPFPEGPSGSIFPELMNDPEYARLVTLSHQHGLRSSLPGRFRWIGVPPDKYTQLSALLLDREFSDSDAAEASKVGGIGAEELEGTRRRAMEDLYGEIRELLGPEVYERFQSMEGRGNDARELTKAIEARLSYSDCPLTGDQAQAVFDAAVEEGVGFMLTVDQIDLLVERCGSLLDARQLASLRQVAVEHNYGKRSG